MQQNPWLIGGFCRGEITKLKWNPTWKAWLPPNMAGCGGTFGETETTAGTAVRWCGRQWRDSGLIWEKLSSSGGILNFSLKLQKTLTVRRSGSRCGYVHRRRSCQLTLQSVVAHVLSINKQRHKPSHRQRRRRFCFSPQEIYFLLRWDMHVCSFKCQCRVKKVFFPTL